MGELLYAAGWRQGVLFDAPSASFAFNKADAAESGRLVMGTRNLKAKERLMVASQDCDLVASLDEEPFVEALLCRPVTPQRAARVDRNSARYFLVDPSTNLVAEGRYRLAFEKAALLQFAPLPWPSSQERLERFVRWLARRYDRPAIPDALYEAFQRPVEQVLEELDRTRPSVASAFSRAVHEVRISMPAHEQPPFELHTVFLISLDRLSDEEVDSLFTVAEAIQARLNPKHVALDPNPRIVTLEEISMAEYYATRPLFLEYLTYQGEQTEGAEPFPRI